MRLLYTHIINYQFNRNTAAATTTNANKIENVFIYVSIWEDDADAADAVRCKRAISFHFENWNWSCAHNISIFSLFLPEANAQIPCMTAIKVLKVKEN